MTPKDIKVILRIQEEIRDLISKNAIVQINDFPSLCLSPIFVIPKKSGDLRVILNLKEFNLFILTQHFRMETLNVILPQLSASDWAVSIDLKDAYLHIPVHPQSRRFLGFQFMDMTYQYKVLPFGLKDSPWVFTRVVATLVGHLRRLGLRVFYYLDDWLLVAESKEFLDLHLQTTLQWTQDLGFLVNWKKSFLVPQRLPSYLGAQLDIPNLLARPLEHRVLALQSLIRDLTGGCLAPALLWPSPPSRTPSLLLSGRLAPSVGVQGVLGSSSSDDPAMNSGSGFPGELEEVFSGSAETSFLSRGSAGHPEFVGSSLGAQSSGSSVFDAGSHRRLLGSRPLVAEISRPSRQLCGLSPQLQDADEASSASLPAVLHPLDRSSGQGLVQGVGLPLSSSRREAFCPPPHSLVITTDASLQGWGQFFIHIGCQGCGRRRRLWTT